MIQSIDNVVNAISGFVYNPFGFPLIPFLLVVGGIVFTVVTRCPQIRLFKESIRSITEKPHTENGVSSFASMMVSTASRVGTGNIIGVSVAICSGGPGAVFWMWVIAILGGATALVESTLAQIYKKKDENGDYYGGPAYYMQDALKQRWLGVVFSILVIFTYAIGYQLLASFNLQSTFTAFSWYSKSTPFIIGIILAVLFAWIIFGGAKKLMSVTGFLVPIMGVLYVVVALIVLVINFRNIPHMFGMIFSDAFDFKSIFGGFSGSCIMFGIKRGLYSNEAGMGSAPNAAARADVSHPVKQGLVQMLSVFLDTLVICSATAFMCLSTDVVPTEEIGGAAYVQESLRATLGSFGPIFIAVAMSLFAFTTLIGNYSYCEPCLNFILKRDAKPGELLVFRCFAIFMVFIGAVVSMGLAWDTADLAQGLMVICNVPVMFILWKQTKVCIDDFLKQQAEGKNPVFHAKEVGINDTAPGVWE